MGKTIWIWVCLVGCAGGHGARSEKPAKVDAPADTLRVSLIEGRVYLVEDHHYAAENSVFHVGDEFVTVVGATWTPEIAEQLVREIRTRTDKPIRYVVNTNFHADRCGGNSTFKALGASIISTRITRELMVEHWDDHMAALRQYFPAYPQLPLVPPDRTFEDRLELSNGAVQLLYFGPSHTRGGSLVYFPQEKILYGSCILKEKLGNLDDADLEAYPTTLSRLKTLEIERIIAGHWSPLHGPELVDTMLSLLKQRVE